MNYDYLIIATGCKINHGETEGLAEDGWHKNIFDFYTIEGAMGLSHFLKYWEGGKMVLNITEMPIKCPVAPLEFVFLADWWFTEQGIRDKVEISFVTPLDGAFTKPRASKVFGDFLSQKNIKLIPDFSISRVDDENNKILSREETEVPYDLLVTTPTTMGSSLL